VNHCNLSFLPSLPREDNTVRVNDYLFWYGIQSISKVAISRDIETL
jgi:hypothetical protein